MGQNLGEVGWKKFTKLCLGCSGIRVFFRSIVMGISTVVCAGSAIVMEPCSWIHSS